MSTSANVSVALARAASAINTRPMPKRQKTRSKPYHRGLAANKAQIPFAPTYRPPLLTTHYIPPHHIAPPLQRRIWPSPYNCAKNTRLEELVSPTETYDFPKKLPDKYAVISPFDHKSSGQFKVMEGDRIMTQLLTNRETGVPYKVDEIVTFDNVLLVGSRDHTLIGRPLIPGANVVAIVDEVTQVVKKRWMWKVQRSRKQRIRGSREWVTILRIKQVNCDFIKYLTEKQLNNLYKNLDKYENKNKNNNTSNNTSNNNNNNNINTMMDDIEYNNDIDNENENENENNNDSSGNDTNKQTKKKRKPRRRKSDFENDNKQLNLNNQTQQQGEIQSDKSNSNQQSNVNTRNESNAIDTNDDETSNTMENENENDNNATQIPSSTDDTDDKK